MQAPWICREHEGSPGHETLCSVCHALKEWERTNLELLRIEQSIWTFNRTGMAQFVDVGD